jgi:phosphate transport system substrate-binding protein
MRRGCKRLSRSDMRLRTLFSAIALISLAVPGLASDVAIIVHPSNPVTDLSLAELSRLFRAEQVRWKSGDKVDLVLQVGVSTRQEVILNRVFHMKADELQAFWLGKVFRGELATPPRTFAADVSVKHYVAANPRAISYIESALLDDSIKAISIDGKHPGEAAYPLAREKVTPTPPPSPTSTPAPRR